jgi:nicotinamidase-related amidase
MMKMILRAFSKQVAVLAAMLFVAVVLFTPSVFAQTVIEAWGSVKMPPAPDLKKVTIDPKTTALLLLDFNKQTCNVEKRPRCIASLPKVQDMLRRARVKGVAVIYSITMGAAVSDIAGDLAPLGGEAVVTSGPDKFMGTDLEKILKDRGIKVVIVTGTAAQGAVLYTASGSVFRGLQVILPVDGISAEGLYPEQYTVWHLLNAPRVSTATTLTRSDLITF